MEEDPTGNLIKRMMERENLVIRGIPNAKSSRKTDTHQRELNRHYYRLKKVINL